MLFSPKLVERWSKRRKRAKRGADGRELAAFDTAKRLLSDDSCVCSWREAERARGEERGKTRTEPSRPRQPLPRRSLLFPRRLHFPCLGRLTAEFLIDLAAKHSSADVFCKALDEMDAGMEVRKEENASCRVVSLPSSVNVRAAIPSLALSPVSACLCYYVFASPVYWDFSCLVVGVVLFRSNSLYTAGRALSLAVPFSDSNLSVGVSPYSRTCLLSFSSSLAVRCLFVLIPIQRSLVSARLASFLTCVPLGLDALFLTLLFSHSSVLSVALDLAASRSFLDPCSIFFTFLFSLGSLVSPVYRPPPPA